MDSYHWKHLYFEDFSICPDVLEVNMDAALDLHWNEQGDLSFIQTCILLPALDLKDPLQTQPGKVAEALPWASEAAAHELSATYQRGNNPVILHQIKCNW